jgi:hypothetical protein
MPLKGDEHFLQATESLTLALLEFRQLSGRMAHMALLTRLAEFVGTLRGGDLAAQKLNELIVALRDCENGALPALFEPNRKHARPEHELAEWKLRAYAAGAMEFLYRDGKSISDAAREVGDNLGFSAETITNWRREFTCGRVKNRLAQEFWTKLVERIKAADKANLSKMGREMIRLAKEIDKP